MDQQLELLTKLLAFYRGRYNGVELETKFNSACKDLMDTGDIKRGLYMKFCVDNDIEPTVRKIPPRSSSSGYSNDGCGGGGYTRSSC